MPINDLNDFRLYSESDDLRKGKEEDCAKFEEEAVFSS
jgi:hypothetical protein